MLGYILLGLCLVLLIIATAWKGKEEFAGLAGIFLGIFIIFKILVDIPHIGILEERKEHVVDSLVILMDDMADQQKAYMDVSYFFQRDKGLSVSVAELASLSRNEVISRYFTEEERSIGIPFYVDRPYQLQYKIDDEREKLRLDWLKFESDNQGIWLSTVEDIPHQLQKKGIELEVYDPLCRLNTCN